MSQNNKEILRVEGLKQYFRLDKNHTNKAVDNISFTINRGEVFSLVGESGCGKTTTGRTLIKLYESTGGEVFFEGTRIISDVKAAKKEHKENVSKAMKVKNLAKSESLDKLSKGIITKEEHDEFLRILEEEFLKTTSVTKEKLDSAKYDSKFEKHADKEGLKLAENIETLPEYKEITKKYEEEIEELKKEIAKLDILLEKEKQSLAKLDKKADIEKYKEVSLIAKELEHRISNFKKEIKLNEKRETQDVKALKNKLIYKNKFLMRNMQMIFQDPIASLNPRMTVKEIVAEGLRINGMTNEREIDERVKDALKTVGLVPEHASRYPHEFSGGQRQRIGIARALVVEPSFIIADEPISALDVSIRAQVINLLNELREEKGITILFIAHDLSVVKYFSDRLAVMYFGKIVEMGDKETIFNNPLHPYTLTLLSSIPLPDPNYEKVRKKLPRYNPMTAHDYSKQEPTLREVEPNHFILCNDDEFKEYQKKLKKA